MAGIMGKRASRHGQLTIIRTWDGCAGKTNTMVAQFGYDRMDLEAIWEKLGKLSDHFSQEHTSGILWNDLGIYWPVTESEAILSLRDHAYPRLKALGLGRHLPSG